MVEDDYYNWTEAVESRELQDDEAVLAAMFVGMLQPLIKAGDEDEDEDEQEAQQSQAGRRRRPSEAVREIFDSYGGAGDLAVVLQPDFVSIVQ